MIQLRKNAFSQEHIDIPFVEDEPVSALVDRVILTNGYSLESAMVDHFQVAINGHIVDRDLWTYIKIKESDTVLVAPRIRGGGDGIFRQLAIIGITVAATYFLGPAGYGLAAGSLGLGLAVAATTIAGTLLLNAIIPPPGLDTGIGGSGSSLSSSQMYTITGQSNSAKKFGYVPQVYGSHRMFPILAANPYTEIEADEETKQLVQYFYAIYDFGFGPLSISDIKIGDTNIEDYANCDFRLVDLNKPAVSTGVWDDVLYDNFIFYKGDVERDGSVVSIDKNENDTNAFLDDYQVVRNASPKVDDCDQEIALDFVCSQGLIAYGTDGKSKTRNIDITVEFSKVGEDIWRYYNDLDYVYDFTSQGATLLPDAPVAVYNGAPDGAVEISRTVPIVGWFLNISGGQTTFPPNANQFTSSLGFPAGTSRFPIAQGIARVGDSFYSGSGNLLGKIVEVTASPYSGFEYIYLEFPTTEAFVTQAYGLLYVEDDLIDSVLVMDSKPVVRRTTTGAARISGNSASQVYATVRFKPKQKAQYKVRITRNRSYSSVNYRVIDRLTLSSISTRFDRDPIRTDFRHVFLEVRVRATNQLNGSIQNLSALAESVLDVWDEDTQTWIKQKTNNPAWVYCDLLTGVGNKRALSKDRLHLPSILEWRDYCEQVPTPPTDQVFILPRFTCNFVLDFDTTLQSIINNVCNSAQASLNIVDGKYGVLIDKLRTTPVQIFTPRNSWGFSSTRNYSNPPDALRVRYIDPVLNWEISETVVYDDGFNEDGSDGKQAAEEFDELSTFACTNYEQAWRFGRYMMAQARLRKETITISVDFEHIVCTRGDFVQVSQDVMRVGGTPARVKSVVGNRVKIDDAIDTLMGIDYGYVYRGVTGIKTSTLTVVDSDEFDLDGDIPSVGDLIIVGEVGKVVIDCLVKTITPDSDLSATLTLVEKADAVYLAESTDTIPAYDPQLSLNVDSTLATPPAVEDLVVTTNDWRIVGGGYEYYIGLDWEVPTGAAFETFEIYVDYGAGYGLWDYTTESFYEYTVNPANLNVEHGFKVLAVSSTGKKIPLIEAPFVLATPLRKVTPPSDVLALYINITGEVIQFEWPAVLDVDLNQYLIRYSPVTENGQWEASIPAIKADKNSTSVSVQARTGTYFIKAVDLNGNESNASAQAVTTIPNLFNLNIISETNDFPDLEGELVSVESDGSGLVLKKLTSGGVETNEYYPEGFYMYENLLDLGEIYTVRLQSLIEAEGFTIGDLMSNWDPLSEVDLISNARNAEWDVETYYRTTDTFNTISEWDLMSDIDPISEGNQDNWTEWKKFTMTDATGRIFQFRLKLISNVPSVTPRVFNGIIKADMPDRYDSQNDLISTVDGLEVVYSPAFAGPNNSPNIQITQDNVQEGDRYVIENKTLNGFKITFYDIDGVAVVRQFDMAVKGYGRKAVAVI